MCPDVSKSWLGGRKRGKAWVGQLHSRYSPLRPVALRPSPSQLLPTCVSNSCLQCVLKTPRKSNASPPITWDRKPGDPTLAEESKCKFMGMCLVGGGRGETWPLLEQRADTRRQSRTGCINKGPMPISRHLPSHPHSLCGGALSKLLWQQPVSGTEAGRGPGGRPGCQVGVFL